MSNSSKQTTIYILRLKHDKYYVGKTQDVQKRYKEHKNGYGSAWTAKYKPLEILETIKHASAFDEDRYTKEYMAKYGIENVRGGTYTQINLTPEDIKYLTKEINSASDLCFNCGKPGHFIIYCPKGEYEELNDSNDIPSYMQTYDLFEIEDLTIDEISKIRSLNISTIEHHLAKCIKDGLITDFQRLNFTKYQHNIITTAINLLPNNPRLKTIKDICPPEITYSMIRYSRAIHGRGIDFNGEKHEVIKDNEVITTNHQITTNQSIETIYNDIRSNLCQIAETDYRTNMPSINDIHNLRLTANMGYEDLCFIQNHISFVPGEVFELLYLCNSENFDDIGISDIFIGITNIKIFMFQYRITDFILLKDIQMIKHEHNLIFSDEIICAFKDQKSERKIKVYTFNSCRYLCNYLKDKHGIKFQM